MALPKEMFLAKGEMAYAAHLGPNLEMPLTAKEDPTLTFRQEPIVQCQRPPGVTNLKQWGEMKMPDGKWKGHSFGEVFLRDITYVNFMAHHPKLTSTWARNFQQYSRLRLQAEAEHKVKIEQEKERHLSQLVAASSSGAMVAHHRGWEVLTSPRMSEMEIPTTSSQGRVKRNAIEVEDQVGMSLELDPEMKDDKEMRLAVLQREVNKIQTELGKK